MVPKQMCELMPSSDRLRSGGRCQSPALIVTVDTEEEGLWSGQYRSHGNTVENIRGIDRFQRVCDEYGIRPTYLVDMPVLEDERSVAQLSDILVSDRCEIGAHLHPWCTPPFKEPPSRRNTYLCNLPTWLQAEKISNLSDSIEERFGRRATSFRAGRWGFSGAAARILVDLGYRVDSSVIPFQDFSSAGGPCYQYAPHQPYFLDDADICSPHQSGALLEVPASTGFNRRSFDKTNRLVIAMKSSLLRRIRAIGALDCLRIIQSIKFTPEQSGWRRMNRLVNAYSALSASCMVMTMHSTSLSAGFSPYVPDQRALDRFYYNLSKTLDYCVGRVGMRSETLSSFASTFPTLEPVVPVKTCQSRHD